MGKQRRLGLAGIAVAATAALVLGGTATASRVVANWKGAESLTPVSLAPDLQRCGPPPANLEGQFTGTGVDTAGGRFTVTASGCLNLETRRVSDLVATDRFVRDGAEVFIDTDDFTLALDEDICTAFTQRPVEFRVAGGTGSLENARGNGHFDFAMTWPECGSTGAPAFVWFDGELRIPGS